jgi:hypothetical protein
MDLSEQAERALYVLLRDYGGTLDAAHASIARQMWLLGYKAGMDTTKAMADEAFAKLEASLS